MMGVVQKVARVVCSAIGEPPRVATRDHVLQRAVQVREANLFEPGFHWPNRIQVHHMSCSANLGNPLHWEVRMQSCLTHSSYNLILVIELALLDSLCTRRSSKVLSAAFAFPPSMLIRCCI